MKVFVAHSTADYKLINNDIRPILLNYFSEKEIIILDRYTSIGEHWPQVESGIKSCNFFIVLITKNSKKSQIVKNEISMALSRKPMVKILPILIDTEKLGTFEPLLNHITPPIYKTNEKNAKSIEEHIENLTGRRKKIKVEPDLNKNEHILGTVSKFWHPMILAFYSKKSIVWVVLIVGGLTAIFFIFFSNSKTIKYKNDYFIVNHIPKIDSLGGDFNLDSISGIVKIDSLGNYRIVVYAYTDMWYIQPSEETPFTDIIDGEWKTETHLGKKYAVMLVKKEFQPKTKIPELPEKSVNIKEIKIIPKNQK
jgi:hypothetical protein